MHEAVVRLVAEDEQEFEFYRAMHYLTGALWAAGLADRAIEALYAVSTGGTADVGSEPPYPRRPRGDSRFSA